MTQAKVELYTLVASVRTALAAVTSSVATANETMLEGIADQRTIQVYASAFEGAHQSRTDRNTFSGPVMRRYSIKVDVYSRPRSQLGEDISAAEKDVYSVIAILEAQATNPPFALSGVHTFHWSGTMGILAYGGVEWWGSQFTLEFVCH